MVDDFKFLPGEDYSTFFRHRVKDGPNLCMVCHGCHKFHNKGFCYKDCDNVASHCKLINKYFTLLEKIIKVLRGGLFFGKGSSNVHRLNIPPYKDISFTTRALQVRFSRYTVSQRSETRQDHVLVNINISAYGSTISKSMEGKYCLSLMIADPSTVSLPRMQ